MSWYCFYCKRFNEEYHLIMCQNCLRYINKSFEKKFLNMKRYQKCARCGNILFRNTSIYVVYDYHCPKCRRSLAISHYDGQIFEGKRSRNLMSAWNYFKVTPEQQKLENELKNNRVSSIIPDKDFHEYFCNVLKEETNRECDCEGTTSEIRKTKAP